METITNTDWWLAVLNEWNAQPERRTTLAGLGNVRFVINDAAFAITIGWDENGVGTILLDTDVDRAVRAVAIEGTMANWYAFLEGRFSAAASVLTRRLNFRGPFAAGFKYSKGFDELAKVARTLTIADEQQFCIGD